MLLVIVTGLPGTGKTTIARRIAEQFNLPLIGKDAIKEILFDSIGWSDREWSRKLGSASMALLYFVAERLLSAGRPLIVESNFRPESDTPRFLHLKRLYGFTPLVIHCRTDGRVLLDRFRDRARSGARHPGHVDEVTQYEYEHILVSGDPSPLDVGGMTLDVDTTDFSLVDYERLFHAVRVMVEPSPQSMSR